MQQLTSNIYWFRNESDIRVGFTRKNQTMFLQIFYDCRTKCKYGIQQYSEKKKLAI